MFSALELNSPFNLSSGLQEENPGEGIVDKSSTDEDLLSGATADTNSMEAGDEQYKNLIAESQMDNIFN